MKPEQALFQPRFRVNAWHRRVHNYVYKETGTERITICKYFWSTLLAFALLPLVVPGRAIGHGYGKIRRDTKDFVGSAILLTIMGSFLAIGAVLAFKYAWWLPFAAIGIGTTFVLGVWGLIELVDKIRYSSFGHWLRTKRFEWSQRKRKEKEPKPPKPERPPKQPSMFWQYLKAKKGKVCPYIEWV